MKPGGRTLSKLTRPRLHAPLARERLFERLDVLRSSPLVWVAGPPGAGKTTVASSYMEAAGLDGLWFQIDAADSDPATFFYYLREAVASIDPRRARTLPYLTPEYLSDLAGFSRRFFRETCLGFPSETLVVFDNYHDLTPDSQVHAAIAAFVDETPDFVNLLILSRSDPPRSLAEAMLNGRLSVLSWNELKLTTQESEAIVQGRGLQDMALARRLHAQADGWFAGFSLLLERACAGAPGRMAVRADAMETVFEYFSQVIYDRASDDVRRVLLVAALLPVAEAGLVSRLAGTSEADHVLHGLYRRHLFIERTSVSLPTYRLHALFRAFLRHRAQSAMSADELQKIALDAAVSFERCDRPEDAFAAWVDAADLGQATRLLISNAPCLLGQGRWRTVLEWSDVVTDAGFALSPWALYWRGRAMAFSNREHARELLDTAYVGFRDSGDRAAQLVCAAGVVEVLYLGYRAFRDMDPWIEIIATLLEEGGLTLSATDELRANAALFMAATYRKPDHPALAPALERVARLLPLERDTNLKVTVASVLHSFENTTLDLAAAELADRVARPLLTSPDLLAVNAGLYLAMDGYTHYMHERYEQALERLADARAVISDLGFAELEMNIGHWRALCLRRAGRLDEAEATIRAVEDVSGSADAGFAPRLFIKSCIAFDRGRHLEAVDLARRAWAITEAGGQYVGTMLVGTVSANIFIGCDAFDLAEEFLERVRRHVSGPATDHFLAAVDLNAAWLEHRRGQAAARDALLRASLARASDARARERLRWYRNALSDLLPVALASNIEAEIARTLVLEFDVKPSHLWVESWPWRVRVLLMGHFEVWVDGRPIEFGRKAPRKTMALLKAIVAFGGAEVSEDRLADALWPGEEADTARKSLGAALHRLRRWLGSAGAIRQSGGTLSVDPQWCWVDALALEYQPSAGLTSDTVDPLYLRHYRGAFLDADQTESWALPMRERLRGRFIRVVERTAGRHESDGDFTRAAMLYERGLDADVLVESFYQGLMRCHLALERNAEAASVYRRLQRTLSQALGVAPSGESRRLLGMAIRTE